LTLHGRSTALNCAITTVQYQPYQHRRILYGHEVGMVRCDWPFTVGYIIILVIDRYFKLCVSYYHTCKTFKDILYNIRQGIIHTST